MGKTWKRVWNGFTSVLVAAAVLLAVLLVGVRPFGFQLYCVLSGSMEPAYRTGSVIYVRPCDPAVLEVGDVITFQVSEDTIATHRIVEVVGEGDTVRFRTKGDANDTVDGSLVSSENLIGKVVFGLPYLGYLTEFIQTPRGRYITAAVGALLVVLLLLPELLSGKRAKK